MALLLYHRHFSWLSFFNDAINRKCPVERASFGRAGFGRSRMAGLAFWATTNTKDHRLDKNRLKTEIRNPLKFKIDRRHLLARFRPPTGGPDTAETIRRPTFAHRGHSDTLETLARCQLQSLARTRKKRESVPSTHRRTPLRVMIPPSKTILAQSRRKDGNPKNLLGQIHSRKSLRRADRA